MVLAEREKDRAFLTSQVGLLAIQLNKGDVERCTTLSFEVAPDTDFLVFSVGGGNREKNVSVNLVRSLELAREVGAKVFGIVGRDGGYTKRVADACRPVS